MFKRGIMKNYTNETALMLVIKTKFCMNEERMEGSVHVMNLGLETNDFY